MILICAYCTSIWHERLEKCDNCGAPMGVDASGPDYRSCPFCHRRLLALSSPACSYCGRGLPAPYVRARNSHLERMRSIKSRESVSETSALEELFKIGGSRETKKLSVVRDLMKLFR